MSDVDYNGADAGGRVSTASGAGAYPAAPASISPAGTVTTPGTYGEHPPAPSEVAHIPVPDIDASAYSFSSLSHQLGALAGLLTHIDADIHAAKPKPDFYKVFYLQAAPYRLDRYDRRFSRLLVPANVAVTIDTSIGQLSVNLVAGWNILNYPDGAMISTAATAANVLYMCSDSQQG